MKQPPSAVMRMEVLVSGRQDSNLRPSAPKADALPDCATPRGPLWIALLCSTGKHLKLLHQLIQQRRQLRKGSSPVADGVLFLWRELRH